MNGNPPDDSSSNREFAYGRSWQEYLARHNASGEPDDEPDDEPASEQPENPEPPEPEPAETGPTSERPEPEPSEPAESPEPEPVVSRVVVPPEEEQFEGAKRRRRRLVAGAAAALAVVLAALFVPDLLPVGGDSEPPPEAVEAPADEAGPTGEGQGADQPQAAEQIALFSSRAEALANALENFGVRLRDFELNRIGCEGLARGIRQVRTTYSGFTSVYETVQSRLGASSVDRYRRLSAEVLDAERSFEGTGCTTPQ